MVQQVRVKLGDFTLPINPSSISVKFNKRIVKHSVPGRKGDIIQVLGTQSKQINFDGQFMTKIGGNDTAEYQSIKLLTEYEKDEVLELIVPLRVSKLKTSTMVVIESINLSDSAGRNDWIDFSVVCTEWRATEVVQNQVVLVNQKDADDLNQIFRTRKQTGE